MKIIESMAIHFKWMAVLVGILNSNVASAWGGVNTGKISQIHVAGAGNLPFRVFLEGTPVLCQGGAPEGYLDDVDGNYRVNVATLLMAKATGATVTLYADVGAFNRCRIGYMVMN